MSGKEMRPLSVSIAASLLPSFSLVSGNHDTALRAQDCHGKPFCHPVDEYCSAFTENCEPCAFICDSRTHNYQAEACAKECAVYNRYEPLKAEIHSIHSTQQLILMLLSILILLIALGYMVKCLKWLRYKRCMHHLLARLQSKPQQSHVNGKDLNATTIQNFNAINGDIERAPSQIYSVAGAAEGSVLTMATPVSTRYPAENSTTPTTVVTEIGYGPGYGYDNQAMVVTPVAEKPAAVATPAASAF